MEYIVAFVIALLIAIVCCVSIYLFGKTELAEKEHALPAFSIIFLSVSMASAIAICYVVLGAPHGTPTMLVDGLVVSIGFALPIVFCTRPTLIGNH